MLKTRIYNEIRYRLTYLLNIILVIALLLGPVGQASAQDVTLTPEPTEVVTVTPDPTEEPTTEPTSEPTEEPTDELTIEPTEELTEVHTETPEALPNLVFAAPEGWDAPLVISSQPGTHINDTLTVGEDAFLDLAVLNDSTVVITTLFTLCLKIDGEQHQCWDATTLTAGEFFLVEDWPLPALAEGARSFEAVVDVNNNVLETDKIDNTWTGEFTWSMAEVEDEMFLLGGDDYFYEYGSPTPPDGIYGPAVEMFPQSVVMLDGVPAYKWNFGGTPTVGAMIAGYFDRHGFDNMYIGPTDGGVMPLTDNGWGTWADNERAYAKNPLIASQDGLDGWTGRGTNEDYWIQYLNNQFDPYITGGWTQHTRSTIGDYMGTSQSAFSNPDGATKFPSLTTQNKYPCSTSTTVQYGDDGLRDFYISRGYSVTDCYSQKTDNSGVGGFSFIEYKAEIDAGNPVMIHLYTTGYYHAITGIGYDDSTSPGTIYFYDTWDYAVHSIPWGGAYKDNIYAMNFVTIVHPGISAPLLIAPNGPVADDTPEFSWNTVLEATNYRLQVKKTSDSTIIIDDIIDASYCSDGVCRYSPTIPLDKSLSYSYSIASGIGNVFGGFGSSITFAYNDFFVKAWPLTLNTTVLENSNGGSVDIGDPLNACNGEDTQNVWFKFSNNITGFYTVSTVGSENDPNITIVKANRDHMVCAETNGSVSDDSKKVTSYFTSGSTYYIGLSNQTNGVLSIKITKDDCTTSSYCFAGVEGDGRVMRNGTLQILNSTNQLIGYGSVNPHGYITGQLFNAVQSGSFRIIITSDYSLFTSTFTHPGRGVASAYGQPAQSITVKDFLGNEIATDEIGVVSSSPQYLSGVLRGTSIGMANNYYLPGGMYDFFASSNEENLMIYQPGKNVYTNNNTPLVMDSSTMVADTFTISLDGVADGFLKVKNVARFGLPMPIFNDEPITLAAPINTQFASVDFLTRELDSSDLTWEYEFALSSESMTITGGSVHSYQVGGELSIDPKATSKLNTAPPISLLDGGFVIDPQLKDAHDNNLQSIYYYNDTFRSFSSPSYILTSPTNESYSYNINSNDYWKPITVGLSVYNYNNLGHWNVEARINFGPLSDGEKIGLVEFEVILPPAADLITEAIPITINTTYHNDTKNSTLSIDPEHPELLDPVNVCNNEDTKSVWYRFTAPSTGIYTLNTFGSGYDPNLTVLQKETDIPHQAVICGETDYGTTELYKKLSFNATQGKTYLLGISSNQGGSLRLQINKETCPSSTICSVGVEGDGRVMHSASIEVIDPISGNSVFGYSYFYGLITINFVPDSSIFYKVITIGEYSLLTQEVLLPGNYLPSAAGLPKISVKVLDISGNQIATNNIVIVNKNDTSLGGYLPGTVEIGSSDYYLPEGMYSLTAINTSTRLQVYHPMVNVTSSGGGNVVMDASSLTRNSFSFELNNASGISYFYNPENWALEMPLNTSQIVTFAAPVNTVLPYIGYIIYKSSGATNRWGCELDLENNYYVPIDGGEIQTFTLGGSISVLPFVQDAPLRSDEAYGYIYPGVKDEYNNSVINIFYERNFSTSSSSSNELEPHLGLESLRIFTAIDGTVYHRAITRDEALSGSTISFNLPVYEVRKANEAYYFRLDPINDLFANPAGFWLEYFQNPIGTWNVKEIVDLGSFGGNKVVSFSFDVYEARDYLLSNDDFGQPYILEEIPGTIVGMVTKGATTHKYDPIIPNLNSKGYGSVWFKMIADRNAVLSIDTFGSDYDTVLTVWQGTVAKLYDRASNDDADDPDIIERTTTSQVSVPIVKGQIYYIEVTEYADGDSENPYILSLDENSKSKPEIEDQQVGGTLNLKIQETEPCYTLTLSTSVGGTVKTLTAPNCASNYIPGTEVTITGTHGINYGFLNWTDPLMEEYTDNPYTFTINADTVLMGNFVLLAAPLNLSRATSWLTNDNTPEFSWDAVPYGSTYEIQIDNVSTFTLPLEHTNTTAELRYSTSTLSDGTHYWRVRTLNNRGEPGAWTAARSFIVDTTPPAVPGLLTPVAAAWVRGTPVFTWSVPATTTGYIFEYADDEEFTTNVITSGTLTTAKTTPAPLALGDHWWHVKVRDAAGNWSEFSAPRKVTILSPLPIAPIQALPASGLLTKDNPVTFTWSEPAYAESYEVDFSLNKKFTPVLNRVAVDDPTATHTFANDGLYYWRVRALNNLNEPGAWSAARAFTLDTTPPAAPAILTPATNSFTITTRPAFTIGTAATAKFYGFEIFGEPDGVDLIWEGRSGKPSYIPTIAQELPFGQLYWRAYAEDAAGNRSTYSNPAGTPFNVSILKIPAHASFVYTTKPSFAWTAVSGATGYRIQVGINSDFTEGVVIDEARPVSTTYIPITALELGTTYYWRMCVNKGGDCSDYTPAYSFTVASVPPTAPLLTAPINGKQSEIAHLDFRWNPVLNAVSYQAQFDKVVSFNSSEMEIVPNVDTDIFKGGFTDGIHYWRVRGLNAHGAPGAWSKTFSFTIDTTPAAVPTPISPVDNAVVNNYMPKFTVNKVLSATRYVFEVCSNNDCSVIRWTKQVTMPTYVPIAAESLPIGDSWWRVRSLDALGNSSEWSPIAHFIVTNLKTPVDGAVITTTSSAKPVFSWLPYPGATGYDLKVSKNPVDPNAPTMDELVIDLAGLTTTSYTVPIGSELTPDVYYWSIVTNPDPVPNTIWYRFTVSRAAPVAPLLVSPAIGWQTNSSPVSLDWSAVDGADRYDLQVSLVKTFPGASLEVEEFALQISEYNNFEIGDGYAPDGLYYWRVRSVSELGVAGVWSLPRTFLVDTVKPAQPVLSTPMDGAAVFTLTPPLSVIKMTDAASYTFEISDLADVSIPIRTGTSLTNTFTLPLDQKLPFGKYYWHAKVTDKAGNESNWSAIRSFEVTILKAPVNNFYTTNPVQPFAWVAVPGATGYEIEVCKEYNESNECVGLQRFFTRPVSTTYTPTAGDAFTDGIYYWRMRAITAGVPGAWTLPNKFTKVH